MHAHVCLCVCVVAGDCVFVCMCARECIRLLLSVSVFASVHLSVSVSCARALALERASYRYMYPFASLCDSCIGHYLFLPKCRLIHSVTTVDALHCQNPRSFRRQRELQEEACYVKTAVDAPH